MLTVAEVNAGYGSSQVLFGMDFAVNEGEAISLIGRNGMGKSTTIRTIMGMLPVRAGQISLRGQSLNRLSSFKVAQLGVGLVPEGRRMFGSLSVEENLLATARSAPKRNRWNLEDVYNLFSRLRERKSQAARTLSGGEQQMLAVGRALMTNPVLLILDELTEGLAPLIRLEIWNCLHTLKKEGQTIIVIDKNLPEMASLLDRHYIVEKGRVVWSGSPDKLQEDPDLASRYLGI